MIKEQFSQHIESSATKDEVIERVTECFDTSQLLQCRITERIKSRQRNDDRNDIATSIQSNADIDLNSNLDKAEEIHNKIESRESQVTEHSSKQKVFDKIQVTLCVILAIFIIWLLFTISVAIKSFKN